MKTLAASIAIILGFVSAGLLVSQSITDEPDGTVSLSYLPDPDPGIPVEEATNRFFSEADGIAPSRGLTPEGSFWISHC